MGDQPDSLQQPPQNAPAPPVSVGSERRDARAFPTTRWSEVARAADEDPHIRREALGRLIAQYAPAFRAHLMRRRGLSLEDAEDIFQGFVCDQVVASELLARVEKERGRLRNYLLGAIDHYLHATWRRERAQKRSPSGGLVRLDAATDERDPIEPAADGEATADVFDLEWAMQVLGETVERMRDECRRGPQPGHGRIWQLFEARVLLPILTGAEPPNYADVVARIGFESPTQAGNALVTGKRMMARLLRGVIAEYAADPGEVEAEMRDLWNIMAAAGRSGGLAGKSSQR